MNYEGMPVVLKHPLLVCACRCDRQWIGEGECLGSGMVAHVSLLWIVVCINNPVYMWEDVMGSCFQNYEMSICRSWTFMIMDSLLFVVNNEMNISFGKFLPRYIMEKKNCMQSGDIVWVLIPLNFIVWFLMASRWKCPLIKFWLCNFCSKCI